jgi:hypothetical protein
MFFILTFLIIFPIIVLIHLDGARGSLWGTWSTIVSHVFLICLGTCRQISASNLDWATKDSSRISFRFIFSTIDPPSKTYSRSQGFRHKYCSFFLSLRKIMCFISHASNRKWQLNVRFAGHSGTVRPQYVTCFMSPTWRVEFVGCF